MLPHWRGRLPYARVSYFYLVCSLYSLLMPRTEASEASRSTAQSDVDAYGQRFLTETLLLRPC